MHKKALFVNSASEFTTTIREGLLGCGFREVPHTIIIDNQPHRFDGLLDGKERPKDPEEWYAAKEEKEGSVAVLYGSYRAGSITNGVFYVNIGKIRVKKLPDPAQHPYLRRKKCTKAPGILMWTSKEGELILTVPALDYVSGKEFQQQSFQESGERRFLTNGHKKAKGSIKGCYFPIWHNKTWKDESVIYVAEGLATAISVYESSGAPCLIGFSREGIPALLKIIKENDRDTFNKIIWAADYDGEAKAGKAREEAGSLGANIVFPVLETGSDFNDLFCSNGAAEVKKQLESNVEIPKAPEGSATDALNKPSSKLIKKGFRMSKDVYLEDMYHVYRGDCYVHKHTGLIWDRIRSLNGLHEAWIEKYGADAEVNSVIYHPGLPPLTTMEYGGETVFNIYKAPTQGPLNTRNVRGGERLRSLIMRARNPYDNEVLLNWLAFHVQNPGKLLTNHIILASKTGGTGKGTFLAYVRKILGESNVASMIGKQPTCRFNQAPFGEKQIIAIDECDPAIFEHSIMKSMLAENKISCEKKYKNPNYSLNRTANIICTTNKTEKLGMLSGKRRCYIILWTEEPMSKGGIEKKAWELLDDNGAIDAEREFLRNMPITIDVPSLDKYKMSQSTLMALETCPIQNFMDNVNISDHSHIPSEDFLYALIKYSPAYRDLNISHYHSRDMLHKKINSAFERRGWYKKRKIIKGQKITCYFNPDHDVNYTGPIAPVEQYEEEHTPPMPEQPLSLPEPAQSSAATSNQPSLPPELQQAASSIEREMIKVLRASAVIKIEQLTQMRELWEIQFPLDEPGQVGKIMKYCLHKEGWRFCKDNQSYQQSAPLMPPVNDGLEKQSPI